MKETINNLKNKIQNCDPARLEEGVTYCETLIKEAQKQKDEESIVFAYLWLAEYFYYAKNDANKLSEYLQEANLHMSNKPSENVIKYYTLKALEDSNAYDLLNRLNCYLEIIRCAEVLQKDVDAANAYGNIADLFRMCHSYEAALHYSENVFEENKLDQVSSKVILITNIVELLYTLKRVDDIPYYIEQAKQVNWATPLGEVFLNCCMIRYHSMKKDAIVTNQLCEKIFKLGPFIIYNSFGFIISFSKYISCISKRKDGWIDRPFYFGCR